MRFVVDEWERQGSRWIVVGRTAIGALKGIWKHRQEPVAGMAYLVELNLEHTREVTPPKIGQFPSVRLDGDTVLFAGICEDRDSEVYYMRFDMDWLEMLEVEAIASQKEPGAVISFSVDWHDIEIYPYDCSRQAEEGTQP